MLHSYLALVDDRGLRLLVLEKPYVEKFLARWAQREHAVLYWAILAEGHASFIRWHLSHGQFSEALNALERLAKDLGPVSRISENDLLLAPSLL